MDAMDAMDAMNAIAVDVVPRKQTLVVSTLVYCVDGRVVSMLVYSQPMNRPPNQANTSMSMSMAIAYGSGATNELESNDHR